jgi:hypothetical protein
MSPRVLFVPLDGNVIEGAPRRPQPCAKVV